jgi:prolyl oligopeptidase
MVTTADHDDRVVLPIRLNLLPHCKKSTQAKHQYLFVLKPVRGHGAGTPTSKIIEQYADKFGFAFFNMGFEPKYNDAE